LTDFTAHFPRLRSDNHTPESPDDPGYNCIAWAAGDNRKWWQPSGLGGHYWPAEVPLEQTIPAYQAVYEAQGYERCGSGILEATNEKVALFATQGLPTHAARQLPDGRWTSKLGELMDITHTLPEDVGGGLYGEIVVFLRRSTA